MHLKTKFQEELLMPESSCSELNNSQAYDSRAMFHWKAVWELFKISNNPGNEKEKATDKIGTYII